MKYKILEDVAIAETAFEIYGINLDELFENAALAISETMVELKSLNSKTEKTVNLENEKVEMLLYDFLSELVSLKDADQLLFKNCKIRIKKNKTFHLAAKLKGEKIDPKIHDLRVDIKAITLHMFEVARKNGRWVARVVVDV